MSILPLRRGMMFSFVQTKVGNDALYSLREGMFILLIEGEEMMFFFMQNCHAFGTWFERIMNHPLVANAQLQDAKVGVGHLSYHNVGIRTRRRWPSALLY